MQLVKRIKKSKIRVKEDLLQSTVHMHEVSSIATDLIIDITISQDQR